MIAILLLPYSLLRWGSGREIVIGLAVMLVTVALSLVVDFTGVVDSIVGSLVLLFPATLGVSVRYWSSSRARELDQVKLLEREQLARELHDTVAHHVSAIAIRAQAGRIVSASDPDAAVDALVVIEDEASRTLAELRSMVGALREDGGPALTPQPGIADLQRLAEVPHEGARVEVGRFGNLDDVSPTVGAAIYRIAQESITNSVRHARGLTSIDVRVEGDEDCVRLTVHDDGAPVSSARSSPGYGVVGMTERAALLGGSLEAGPAPSRGMDRACRAAEGGAGSMTVRVLVADDQEIVRTGLTMILDAQPGIDVVGQAVDGREAVAMARRLRPDVDRDLARHLLGWLADHAYPRSPDHHLDPPRGFAAESVAASVLYTTAYVFEAPISTTHTITSAVMGVGATKRLSAVRWGVAAIILIAWVLTFPMAGLAAAFCYWVSHLLLEVIF